MLMNLTILVLLSTFIFLLVFDVYIIMKKGKHESISAHVIRFYYENKKAFLIGIISGFILGHLFWSMKTEDVYNNTECITKEVE